MVTEIAGFEVVAKIGEGGMGAVYKARDRELDRLVAIKLLRVGLVTPELRQRFRQEARAAASLSNPHIVTIYAFGEHQHVPYIAMEFVHGTTLDRIIRLQRSLNISEKLELVDALCDGLGYAHRHGVVHRDIKPSNLILSASGVLKILDFGIAKAVQGPGLTHTDTLIGTPNYMSPEQFVHSRHVDARSDVFAVGAVLYELVCQEQAFPGDMFQAMDRILNHQLRRLTEVCSVDPELAEIADKALSVDPDDRYHDLDEMRRHLADVRHRNLAASPPRTWEERRTVVIDDTDQAAGRDSDPTTWEESTPHRHLHGGGTSHDIRPSASSRPARARRSNVWLVSAIVVAAGATGVVLLQPTWPFGPSRSVDGSSPPETAAPAREIVASPADTSPADAGVPTAVEPLRMLFADALRRGDVEGALGALREAHRLAPASELVTSGVSQLLSTAQTDLTTAMRQASDRIGTRAAAYTHAASEKAAAGRLVEQGKPLDAIATLAGATRTLRAASRRIDRPTAGEAVAGQPAARSVPAPSPSLVGPGDTAAVSDYRPPSVDVTGPTPVPPLPTASSPSGKVSDAPAVGRSAVEAVLRAYTDAYEDLDAERLRKIWPTAPTSLDRQFRGLRSYRIRLADVRVTLRGAEATVGCVRHITTQSSVGRPQTTSQPTTMRLERRGEAWLIVDVR